MMKITGLSHIFKWENLHNWWLTKYFFAPLYAEIIPLGRRVIKDKRKQNKQIYCQDICTAATPESLANMCLNE